jgi:CRP-like cAMP-binding protein/membrane protein YdbS with pleckstrin-like domain
VTDKANFLAELPIFSALNDDEYLEDLAAIAREYEFDEGAVIAYQRDVVEDMYIVRSGRLYAQRLDDRGAVRESKQYFAGDYFDDVWLFVPQTHPMTVTAAQNGRLLLINNHDFVAFVTQHPGALAALEPYVDLDGNVIAGLSPEAWAEAKKLEGREDSKSSRVNLLPDELVEYQARRSRWYLLIRLFWPVFWLLLGPTLIYLGLNGRIPSTITTVFAAIFAFVSLLFIGFRLLDWSNDYFVITNKHLIHHEFDLRSFRITVIKIPIKQVQSAEILKPTLLANLFNIGSARVTTAAQKGVILFDNIDDPIIVKETLNRLSGRVQQLNAGEAQLAMRHSIESHFLLPPSYRTYSAENEEEAAPRARPADESFFTRLRRSTAWRSEENGVITYRKHIFVLFAEVWLPSAVAFALIGIGYVMGTFTPISDSLLLVIFGVLALINLGWFIWEFEDWRNDIFQVSDRFVLDIDRQPFGFGESRKQAPIGNVQNVNAERPGLLATIFNYGYVSVETAGAATDITFEKVPKPSAIQSDIFRKLEVFEQSQRLQRGAERREEYAVLLDVYQQAAEQSRIPKRTPLPGEFIENPNPGG